MSVTTYTSPAWIEEIKDHSIVCPRCKSLMTVKEYYKQKKFKRGEHWLTTAICYNGCKNEQAESGDIMEYYFVGHNINDLYSVQKRLAEKEAQQ